MLEITTNNLKSRKKVEIDGHPFVVRKLGAGEQLTLNQYFREADKLSKVDGEMSEASTKRVLDLTQKMLNIMAGLFNDGGDGSRSRSLVKELSEDELKELLSQIFAEDNEQSA